MSKLSERRREIQAMDMASAQEELQTLRRRLFELRLQKERGEVKNNRLFPQTKADIARLMHHLGELNSAAELEAAGLLISEEHAALPAPETQPKQTRTRATTATAKSETTSATTTTTDTTETTDTTTTDEEE